MNRLKVGIVEDEPINAEFLEQVVRSLGHSIILSTPCEKEALESIIKSLPDLLLLDINLKGGMEGVWLAEELNRLRLPVSVIYISAYRDKNTVKKASGTEPFNFLSKPFDATDIEIAITLFIGKLRKKEQDGHIVRLGEGYLFDIESLMLSKEGIPIKLTLKEAELFALFCRNRDRLLSSETITSAIWGEKPVSESTIRDTIYRIRKKIPEVKIDNISSLGYILTTF